ncbi:hypothetical protein T02_9505 [Trichinella nativa]|uniref:Uncharacterized protein n=1 Tax=Trichinella nativa TaxID=6335 RepID=A0A0V1L4G8_9BILA|nr:hypothetical protein T02_9505 [Trichinella nativa]
MTYAFNYGLTHTESPTANRPFISSAGTVPRVAAVSRRNVVQVHRLFHRAILSRSDDLHASMASLRYAIAGRRVGTWVPHSDSPPGDELRKDPSSESGVVVRRQTANRDGPQSMRVRYGRPLTWVMSIPTLCHTSDPPANLPTLNLETSSFPLSRRRIQQLAWLTAADHLSHLALGYCRIRPPCEVQRSSYSRVAHGMMDICDHSLHAQIRSRCTEGADPAAGGTLLHADFTRSTSISYPNTSTSDSIMPTFLQISISPDVFVFSLTFPERPSDTHRCTVAESVINRILLICQLRAKLRPLMRHPAQPCLCVGRHPGAATTRLPRSSWRLPKFWLPPPKRPISRAQGHASSPPARSRGSALSARLRRSLHPSSLWRR